MAEHIPDQRARALRVVGAVLAGALGTLLIAAGIWMALRPQEPSAPTQTEIEPAEQTQPQTPTALPVAPEASGTADAGSTSTAGGSGTAAKPGGIETSSKKPARAARVAYRLGSDIYVASEDGSDARSIVSSARGPYALSPDAGTLAVIEGGVLELVDVATAAITEAGPAADTSLPCWLADSSRVIFRRRATGSAESFKLYSVARTGGEVVLLAAGSQAAVSPDGRVVVVRGVDEVLSDGSAYIHVSLNGSVFRPVRLMGGLPTSVATNGARVFVGMAGGAAGAAVISLLPDGRDSKQIVGPVPESAPAMWAAMRPSPDGTSLALAAQGDDGYSRSFIVAVEGGQLVGLVKRRDSYLHCWSASGDRLFLIEGNAFQGERTSLVSVTRNGTGRRVVAAGAE